MERLDYVMECRETPDFMGVTGGMGGDVITCQMMGAEFFDCQKRKLTV